MDAMRKNILAIKRECAEDVQIMGVVKADAYGHGAAVVSQELLKLGVEYLAVSNIDEAMELRTSGISSPILLLGPVESSEFGKLIEFNIYATVISADYARELSEAYRYRGVYPKVHIEIDAGMGRLGIPLENALLEVEQIARMEGIIIDGVYAHFPSADADKEFSEFQIKELIKLSQELKKLEIKVRYFHMANSAAIFHLPSSLKSPFNMVRPGLGIYGYAQAALSPSLTLKTKVLAINRMKKGQTVSYLRSYTILRDVEHIAVLPIGYADGIPTLYSNKGRVFIKDAYYPVVGRVCMDYMMVSLGENSRGVQIGDEVIILGGQKITMEEFGKVCKKIPYEITCDISKRVPRIYLRKEDKR
jgi:alanine racemase